MTSDGEQLGQKIMPIGQGNIDLSLLRAIRDSCGIPATATALAEATPLTRQAILKHLQVLEAAGLMEHERYGREVRYRVTPKPLASAVAWIVDTAGQWDQRLDRLRKLTG